MGPGNYGASIPLGSVAGALRGAQGESSAQLKSGVERESGAVGREMSRLSDAVSRLEAVLADHVNRIAPVILNVPQPPNGGAGEASAPDANVCNVAEGVRIARKRVDEITAAVMHVTSRIDL
jgi:hypothetical protein